MTTIRNVVSYISSKGMHIFEPVLFFTNGISGLIVILSLLLQSNTGDIPVRYSEIIQNLPCVNIINSTDVMCFEGTDVFSDNNLSIVILSLIINIITFLILIVWLVIRTVKMVRFLRKPVELANTV